jgi:hypothetical protein
MHTNIIEVRISKLFVERMKLFVQYLFPRHCSDTESVSSCCISERIIQIEVGSRFHRFDFEVVFVEHCILIVDMQRFF